MVKKSKEQENCKHEKCAYWSTKEKNGDLGWTKFCVECYWVIEKGKGISPAMWAKGIERMKNG